jgi:hypothetical protein
MTIGWTVHLFMHNCIYKSIHLKHGEMFYQSYTARKTNSDNQLVRKDIDVNEHERLSNITLRHKLK